MLNENLISESAEDSEIKFSFNMEGKGMIFQKCEECGNTTYKELRCRECGNIFPFDVNEYANQKHTVTDEEIEKEAVVLAKKHAKKSVGDFAVGFNWGAKWMRDKLNQT